MLRRLSLPATAAYARGRAHAASHKWEARRGFSDKIADKLLLDNKEGTDPTNKCLAFVAGCLVLYGLSKAKAPEY